MWFTGPISDAIALAKKDEKLLIVFIHDDEEKSLPMIDCWNTQLVQTTCIHHKCVALKFNINSTEAKQFAEFYPVPTTPISFFIDSSGIPIEIIVDILTDAQLNEKLHSIVEKMHRDKSKPNVPASPSLSSTSNLTQDATLSSAEKVEKMRQKIKEVQEKKRQAEIEQEKEREIRRREEGKAIAQTQEQKRETDLAEAVEQRRRDKVADREYLHRLREQIAADRAEKAAKFHEAKNEETAALAKKRQEQLDRTETDKSRQMKQNEELMKMAKIHFRLADGRSEVEVFPSDSTLNDARRFVTAVFDVKCPFALVQSIPKREFKGDDWKKTFRELDLAPSAVLMVVLGNKSTGSVLPYQPNWIISILSMLFLPVVTVYNWIYSFIFPPSVTPPRGSTATRFSNQNRPLQNDRRQDQMGRLNNRNAPGDADDNATWNGNSTQQL